VDGIPITEWCVSERLPLEGRLRLFRVVCEAVQHAHRALVVHRDLKPSNIFVARSGNVKLLDFGIAKLLDPVAWDVESTATRAEMRLVTPEYGAPEQRQGGPTTTATDVYALGVVLYELLTGARPAAFSTKGVAPLNDGTSAPIMPPSEAVRRLACVRPESGQAQKPGTGAEASRVTDRRKLARRIRGDLDRIVMTALRDEPDRRYASAGQLAEEIERFLDGRAVLAQPDTLRYRARKFVGRNRFAVTAAAVLASCITAFGIVAALQARAVAEQGRVARMEQAKAEQVVQVLVDLFETTNPAIRPDGDQMPIREFLAGAESRALTQLSSTPVVKAKLQQVFGLIHSQRGQYTPARETLEAALAEQRRLLGPDHPDTLESLHALGRVLYGSGDGERARTLLQESLDRHRRVYGDEHEKTARAIHALAPLAPNLDAAGALFSQALEVRQRVLPPNHPDLAMSLGALAQYHNLKADRERSRALYQRALAVFEGPGARHPKAVGLMNDYASLLGGLSLHAEAEAMQRQAITVGQQVLGPGTLIVANLTNNLGTTLTSLGRLAEAEHAFREAHAQHLALLGENHWRTRNLSRNVGRILALQQQYAEALPWMDRAIAVRASDDDAGREGIRAQRAWILFRMGRRAEALEQATAAVSALERMTKRDGSVLAISRPLVARMLNEIGRPKDAEPPARAAVEWLERWGPSDPRHAEAACEMGRAQLLQGMTAEGRATLERCLPVYRAWGQADREVVESLERLLADSARRSP
jgi:serine/threonine-protein kinase